MNALINLPLLEFHLAVALSLQAQPSFGGMGGGGGGGGGGS